jgi:hypothetical protein
LAIDSSGSITGDEFRLQIQGIRAALMHPDVLAAIERAGGLSIAAVVWADEAAGVQVLRWHVIRTAADSLGFASAIAALPHVLGGATDIGNGIWAALDLFADPALCASRWIVDVSGDGRESLYPRRRHGASLLAARSRADALGVTINGLAITEDDAKLELYYRRFVATGPGAFVIPVDSIADFGKAMRAKLLREIEPAMAARDGHSVSVASR